MSENYYRTTLAADRLKKVYDIAPSRVQQYLAAEIAYVADRLEQSDSLLEIGCGYGRVMRRLSPFVRELWGVDHAVDSLRMGRRYLAESRSSRLVCADAIRLPFCDESFDRVICIQNGPSAIKVDTAALTTEALRVCRPDGLVMLSSYAEEFWNERLEWFRIQADEGLLGAIDEDSTGDGVIVCHDGFRATTFSADDFRQLTSAIGVDCELSLVDGSSLFCVIRKSRALR
jgi:2-polyprenyl-6-hydroxyphenyl methylase/3-demethylubiquinone-9 3-methyltransferase